MADWLRHGECNGCGWCCTHLTKLQIAVIRTPGIDQTYYEARGVRWVHQDGREVGVFQGSMDCPCPRHDSQALRCGIYDTRPQTCRDFPLEPGQIVDTPCTYWFTRVEADGTITIQGGRGALLARGA